MGLDGARPSRLGEMGLAGARPSRLGEMGLAGARLSRLGGSGPELLFGRREEEGLFQG
jgi:hypothetical protein